MTNLTKQYEFKNVDWKIAGHGDARDGNTTVTINGVTGTPKFAFMYWGELNFDGSSDNTVTLNGTTVVGQKLGTSVDTCWGSDESVGYFANVSALVKADGSYDIAGMGRGGQGASIVVVYDDGNVTNNRDITIFAGNDSSNTQTTPGEVNNINLGNIAYEAGEVNLTLSVGDGQQFSDDALTANGTVLGVNQFSGSSGALWDVNTYDITSILSPGNTAVNVSHVSGDDCLQFVTAIVDKAAKAPVLLLDFDTKIPIDYYTTSASWLGLLGLSSKQTFSTRAGTEPLGVFTDDQKLELVGLVQDIFDRSGVAMEVTPFKPASGDYHSVRFTSTELRFDSNGDGTVNARLLGQAYEGIDRYNTNKSDVVAVLMDGSDAMLSVAETVAHEGAHALGVRHINPVQGAGTEVMDYDSRGLETFVKAPAFITEAPVDGTAPSMVDHNPTYHIRRFVNGESDAQLMLENIKPGAWDKAGTSAAGNSSKVVVYSLNLSELAGTLTSLAVLLTGQSALIEGDDGSDLGTLMPLEGNLDGTGTLGFSLPEGVAFRIVGSTGSAEVLDTVLRINPDAADPYAGMATDGEPLTGALVQEDASGNPTEVGNAALAVVEVIDVAPPSSDPVLQVSIDKDAILESGGEAIITVSRGADTSGELSVVLSSDDTSEALVPALAIIADGETQVQVALTGLDDDQSDGVQTATITALADGFQNGTDTIKVLDDEGLTLPVGTDADDVIQGTEADDPIYTLGGNDLANGAAGNDLIFGGQGHDTVIGGTGGDTLYGGPGHDVVIGGQPGDSSNSIEAQVFRVYQATLDRFPDTNGLNNWSGRIKSDALTLTEVTAGFVNSQEFANVYGNLGNSAFVSLLYNNVLGREADEMGLENWTARLDGGLAREAVVVGFSNSPEFQSSTRIVATAFAQAGTSTEWVDDVFRLYQATLARSPDDMGLQNWSGRLADGTPYLDVVTGFVASQEFQTTYGALDNSGFVSQLYLNVLGREGDEVGQANWVGRLEDGMSREEVVSGFAQSPEFINDRAAPFTDFMRDQMGDWIEGGAGNDLLVGSDHLADVFVFNADEDGQNTVLNLDPWDTLALDGFGYEDRADALAHMTAQGPDVVFVDQGVTIQFSDNDMADLTDVLILV
jgi:hypothetical protein